MSGTTEDPGLGYHVRYGAGYWTHGGRSGAFFLLSRRGLAHRLWFGMGKGSCWRTSGRRTLMRTQAGE